MDPSETQIIKECQAGNLESFVSLYDQYAEKIYRFHYFRTNQRELAEDLTSQTFFKAMDKIKLFKERSGTFQSWLYQIARNLLIDEYRRRKPSEPIDLAFDIANVENVEADTDRSLTTSRLHSLLAELPTDSQELIKMRLWDELSYAEIAVITGKSEGSLKMKFSRIITKLRKHTHLLIATLIFARW